MNKHLQNQERFFIKQIVSKYSTEESIVALNRVIKQLEFDKGVLKSELSELSDKYNKIKIELKELNTPFFRSRQIIKELKSKLRDLEHQLKANNIPLPKKYQSHE